MDLSDRDCGVGCWSGVGGSLLRLAVCASTPAAAVSLARRVADCRCRVTMGIG